MAARKTRRSRKEPGLQETREPFFSRRKNQQRAFFSEAAPSVQAKLRVGKPGDPFEREADATADRVVNQTAQPGVQKKEEPKLQRQAEKEEPQAKPDLMAMEEEEPQAKPDLMAMEEEEPQAKPDLMAMEEEEPQAKPDLMAMEEEEPQAKPDLMAMEKEEPQAKAQPHSGGKQPGLNSKTAFSQRLRQSKGKGRQLPRHLQAEMARTFDTDLTQVRIHTDQNAAQLSQAIKAQAFTHGQDIFFNRGKFEPDSQRGRHLIAHELTHVVQQKKR